MHKKIFRGVAITSILAIILIVFVSSIFLQKPKSIINENFPDYSPGGVPNLLNFSSADEMLTRMKKYAEKDGLQFYLDETNLVCAVKDTAQNVIYTSNPYNASNDEKGQGDLESAMKSQIVINYYDQNNIPKQLYSYSDCVSLGQYSISPTGDGADIFLSLGKDVSEEILPEAVVADDFEKHILDKIEDTKAQKRLLLFFKKVDISELTNDTVIKDYIENYPGLETDPLYILSQSISEKQRTELEGYLKAIGYTKEDKQKDERAANYSNKEKSSVNVKMKICYSIHDGKFYASIPADQIFFDSSLMQVESIKFLEFFGASNQQIDPEGYVFLPDGCGTVLSFSDSTQNKPGVISGNVYGTDWGLSKPESPVTGQTFYFPVFGLKSNQSGFFGIVEKGSAVCSIASDIGGVYTSYYTAYPILNYVSKEALLLGEKSTNSTKQTVYKFGKNVYSSDFTVSYSFLYNENASYIGMADCYQKYLCDQGMASHRSNPISFNMMSLGSVQYKERFLGLEYNAEAILTSYKNNQTILEYLQKNGIDKCNLLLKGWQKNGLNNLAGNHLRLSEALGGKSAFNALFAFAKENQYGIYPINDLMYVNRDKLFDGFTSFLHTGKTITGQLSNIMPVSPDTDSYDEKRFQYVVAPRCYGTFLSKFLAGLDKTDADALSLSDFGCTLNSDNNSSHLFNREETMALVSKLLREVTDKGYKIAFNGANAYCLPSADFIYNLPIKSSGLKGESYDIPFAQMVLSGYISYAATPMNYVQDTQEYLLKCIEFNTSPMFNSVYQNQEVLKYSDFNEYFNVDFSTHHADWIRFYQYVRTALNGLDQQKIIAHEKAGDALSIVSYDNGECIYINYGKSDIEYAGYTVKAQDYLRVDQSGGKIQ